MCHTSLKSNKAQQANNHNHDPCTHWLASSHAPTGVFPSARDTCLRKADSRSHGIHWLNDGFAKGERVALKPDYLVA